MSFALSCLMFVSCSEVQRSRAPEQKAAEAVVPANVNVRDFGAVGDGDTVDDLAFEKAIKAFDGAPGSIQLPAGLYRVRELSIPEGVTLVFDQGAAFNIPYGAHLAIEGTISTALHQIFYGGGKIQGSFKNTAPTPQWFGARGDGVHDDTKALQRAADFAFETEEKLLYIPAGQYLFTRNVDLRCNVRSEGVLVRKIEIDDSRTHTSTSTFVPKHYPKVDARIRFLHDHEEVELKPDAFIGIKEGDAKISAFKDLALAQGEGVVSFKEGDVIRLLSTDYFKSRRNNKGDEYYTRNDIVQVTSQNGDVTPEFAFSYPKLPAAKEWNEATVYNKGDYCLWEGNIYKATWPSGPGSSFKHNYLGSVKIGPVHPDSSKPTTKHEFYYSNKTKDSITVWCKVETRVWYRPADTPLTVDGLRVEVGLKSPDGKTKRISTTIVSVERDNVVFNNALINVVDRDATIGTLLGIARSVNITFNNSFFSGATYHGLGYNILASNIANLQLLNCTSVNTRKGMDARHAKNVTIDGGTYTVIHSHYGRNYEIRNATLTSETTYVPGYTTPEADLEAWTMRASGTIGFNGANLLIENCVIQNPRPGILSARSDIGDLYGEVVLRNIRIVGNEGDVSLISHQVNRNFDFVYPTLTPDTLQIENVSLENSGKLNMTFTPGKEKYRFIQVVKTGPFGKISGSSEVLDFVSSEFQDAVFTVSPETKVNLEKCVFSGVTTGLSKDSIGRYVDNVTKGNATGPMN